MTNVIPLTPQSEVDTLPLTEKQERVWRFIRSCPRSPSYREMESRLGLGLAGLNETIAALKERGYVHYLPGRARSIVALNPNADLSQFSTADLMAELERRALG